MITATYHIMVNFVNKLLNSIGGNPLNKYKKFVEDVNFFENNLVNLSDKDLSDKTIFFKKQIQKKINLEDLLPEIFAVVREAARRTINMRHFDVQIIGGKVLHEGKIAEMKTGEGKTLVATLAAYANALNNY